MPNPELFKLGFLAATPESLSEIEKSGEEVLSFVRRHHSSFYAMEMDATSRGLVLRPGFVGLQSR